MPTKGAKDVFVVEALGKGWTVTVEGEVRPLHVVPTQDEAIALARPLAQKYGGVVVIKQPDGRIREEKP